MLASGREPIEFSWYRGDGTPVTRRLAMRLVPGGTEAGTTYILYLHRLHPVLSFGCSQFMVPGDGTAQMTTLTINNVMNDGCNKHVISIALFRFFCPVNLSIWKQVFVQIRCIFRFALFAGFSLNHAPCNSIYIFFYLFRKSVPKYLKATIPLYR